jgi:hypothetical protein
MFYNPYTTPANFPASYSCWALYCSFALFILYKALPVGCERTTHIFLEEYNLYERQQALEDEHLQKYVAKLGLDLARFNNDMSTHAYLLVVFVRGV